MEASEMQKSGNSERAAPYRLFPSFRLFIAILTGFGITCMVLSTNVLGFTLVCMVNTTAVQLHDHSSSHPAIADLKCGNVNISSTSSEIDQYRGTYVWTKGEQANLLAAVNWAAIWLLIPAGWVADAYGAKLLFAAVNLISGVGMILTPIAAVYSSVWAVFAVRIIQGLLGSFQPVAMMRACTHWVPVSESGLFIAIAMSGFPIGNLLLMSSSGFLCSSSLGWQAIFYLYGVLILLWVVIWMFMYTDDPLQSRFCSHEEAEFISENTSRSISSSKTAKSDLKVPWLSFIKSAPVWGTVISQFSFGWIAYFYALYIPTYLKESIRVGEKVNGTISALPFVGQLMARATVIPISHCLHGRISETTSVKMWNTACMGGTALICVGLCFLTCSNVIFVAVLLFFYQFFIGYIVGGCFRSYVLIAPKYSGILSSIGQALEYVCIAIMSYAVGFATEDGTPTEWRNALIMTAVVTAAGGVAFILFASGVEQDWAKTPPKKSDPI